jgi:hypothetical protein
MILGLSVSASITLHVIISLIGIVSGLVVLYGMLRSQRMAGWTAIFLVTTLLTTITGFFLPAKMLLPSHITGILSLIVLLPALAGLYVFRLVGAWRWIYVGGAIVALYLNVFVAVVQAFLKLPFLTPLAPTQSEPPFLIAQAVVLVLFVALGALALRAFHPSPAAAHMPA